MGGFDCVVIVECDIAGESLVVTADKGEVLDEVVGK